MKAKQKWEKKRAKNSSPDWNGIRHKAISMQQPSSWHVNLHAAEFEYAVCIFVEPPATFLYCFGRCATRTRKLPNKRGSEWIKKKEETKNMRYFCITPIHKNWMRKNELKIKPDIHTNTYTEQKRVEIKYCTSIMNQTREMNEIFEKAATMTTQSNSNNKSSSSNTNNADNSDENIN